MVTLKNEINFKALFFVIIISSFSCGSNKDNQALYEKFIERNSNTRLVYELASDTISSWCENRLDEVEGMCRWKYNFDSLICINSEANKVISSLHIQCTDPGCLQEELKYFYGVKIREKWYFFLGPSITLPREYYQKDIHTPLSFEKLHEIAMKEIYSGYLKKNWKGNWEINDDFFSDLTSVAWCVDCKTQADWDEAYMNQVRLNWSKRDTSIIKSQPTL